MAAPHVSGVAALVEGRRLTVGRSLLTPIHLASLLRETAYPPPGGCPARCGSGNVDAEAAGENAGSSNLDLAGRLIPILALLLED